MPMKPLTPLHPRRKPKGPTPAPRSSNVRSHEYDPDTSTLTVHFNSGRSYRYADVAPDLMNQMGDATSTGGFLHQHIIGRHDATEIFPKRDD